MFGGDFIKVVLEEDTFDDAYYAAIDVLSSKRYLFILKVKQQLG